MKVKYRNNTLQPNNNLYCVHCDLCEPTKANIISCFGLCHKTHSFGGFSIINDCEILEL
jgi:hypothetical protein